MDSTFRKSVKATDLHAQYDACAKELLSNKILLAHILKETIEEFKSMKPQEIVPLIEGEAYVSEVPIDPGQTNQTMKHFGAKIVGTKSENTEVGEGQITFDIIFYVRMREGLSKMLINVEAQKSVWPGYPIKNRAIYYTSRMISSQKERDFVKSNYKDLLKTYSIWICFNMKENCLNHLHMVDTPLVGNYKWDGVDDLLNVVLIGLDKRLTNAPIKESERNLHGMLGILFSEILNAEEKMKLLETEFQIQENGKMREELDEMCNLSYAILERGIEEGIEKGKKEGVKEVRRRVIQEMLLDRQSYHLIRKYTGASDDEIRAVEEALLVK